MGASDGDRLENVTREEALNWVDEHLDLMETLGGENGRDYWIRVESKLENTD